MSLDNLIVVKFGGWSLKDADNTSRSANIVMNDPKRKFIVVSGPKHVTDYLIDSAKEQISHGRVNEDTYKKVIGPFEEICTKLGLPERLVSIKKAYHEILKTSEGISDVYSMQARRFIDNVARLGEFFEAQYVFTPLLNKMGRPAVFLDPKDVIVGSDDPGGSIILPDPDKKLATAAHRIMENAVAVMAGYYCATRNGGIVTLSRGGSDTSGGHAAAELDAKIYENRTDNVIRRANPKIVEGPLTMLAKDRLPLPLEVLTYNEALELTFMGFGILNHEAIRPCMNKAIPIYVINDNSTSEAKTKIVAYRAPDGYPIAGVAHKPGYVSITVRAVAPEINNYVLQRELGISSRRDVHINTDNSSVSFLIPGEIFIDDIVNERTRHLMECFGLKDNDITVRSPITLISVVGQFMKGRQGINRRASSALDANGISTSDIKQGGSEFCILYGVEERGTHPYKGEDGVRAIYNEFFVRRAFERIPREQSQLAKAQYLKSKK